MATAVMNVGATSDFPRESRPYEVDIESLSLPVFVVDALGKLVHTNASLRQVWMPPAPVSYLCSPPPLCSCRVFAPVLSPYASPPRVDPRDFNLSPLPPPWLPPSRAT